ncbi:MAG: PIG-L family deacetylase [Balneolaceae bacterium]|nr:PIG-L family deacetylase [Balneolaceae bacterium]
MNHVTQKALLLLLPVAMLLAWYEFGTHSSANESLQDQTILAIFAHPDDEMTIGPALSKWAREGHRVYLALATDGRFGAAEHFGIPAGDSLAAVRTEEIRCAANKLGIEPPRLIGLRDGFAHRQAVLSDAMADFQRLHEAVYGLFEELQPDVVITWNPGGGYGHPDHRIVSNIVTEVYQLGGGKVEWPRELLYTGMPSDRLHSVPNATEPAVQWFIDSWHVVSPKYLPVRIAYTPEDMQNARASLRCHASQFTEPDMEEISELLNHVYNGAVTFRPWNGDGSAAIELLE